MSATLPSNPVVQNCVVSFPTQSILLLALQRPERLNAIDLETSRQMKELWEWFDKTPHLLVGIITGSGKAFCSGGDLHEWNSLNEAGKVYPFESPGLGGLSRRKGRKPIIAAVNGVCMGGGFEIITNCDMVIAERSAVFGLPEIKRGVAAVAGCLPRLARIIGKQRASELALTGRDVTAEELHVWGLVNRVVENGEGEAVREAVALAKEICESSPDSIIVTKAGINLAWEKADVEDGTSELLERWYKKLIATHNFVEGIQAFVQKRPPQWQVSRL